MSFLFEWQLIKSLKVQSLHVLKAAFNLPVSLSLFFFNFIYFRKHLNIVSSSLIIFFHLNTDIYQKKVKENERSAKTTTLSNQPTIVT